MQNVHDRINAIRRLADVATDFDPEMMDQEVLALIAKLAVGGPVPISLSPTIDELHIAHVQGKIPAIKMYRERTQAGLKEAKDAIEQAADKLGLTYGPPTLMQNPR